MRKILPTLVILFSMSSCYDKLVVDANKVSRIDYSFHDSSVPPPYHRSYNISITESEVTIKVDSYGDVLVDKNFDISMIDYQNLIKTINQAQLRSGKVSSEEGCTGGTSEELSIFEESQEVYTGRFEHCGGNTISEKYGDYENVVNAIKRLVPNLSEWLK